MEWAHREREREIEEKTWRGDQKGKGGRKGRKGENESLSKSGGAWSLLFWRGVPTDLKECIDELKSHLFLVHFSV